jgi:mannose-1-phosphate guanylyltransferase
MRLDGEGPGTHRVEGYDEKPETRVVVSMGLYVLEPSVLAHIPAGEHYDIPDLVHALVTAGEPVGAHVHDGYWRDIGRHDDYEEAQAEIDDMLPKLLPSA